MDAKLISLNATQMLYDFGKVKSGVDIEQAKLAAEQANVLSPIDNVAYETANAIVNIKALSGNHPNCTAAD